MTNGLQRSFDCIFHHHCNLGDPEAEIIVAYPAKAGIMSFIMKNTKKKNKLPTTAEIFQSTRSEIALSAILRSGGGFHQDTRKAKARKNDWKNDHW